MSFDKRAYKKAYLKKKRLHCQGLIYRHYGDICKCCGEDNKKFLTIDHINGHIEKEGKAKLGGGTLAIWIVNNNYPIRFQILCFNCNMAKGIFGECPHKEK